MVVPSTTNEFGTKVVLAGMASVTTTEFAASWPVLVTLSVYSS